MRSKPGELKCYWSKKENDLLFSWGEGVQKYDGSWLNSWYGYHRGFDDTFLKELESRGYDLTTLKFSVKKKV